MKVALVSATHSQIHLNTNKDEEYVELTCRNRQGDSDTAVSTSLNSTAMIVCFSESF